MLAIPIAGQLIWAPRILWRIAYLPSGTGDRGQTKLVAGFESPTPRRPDNCQSTSLGHGTSLTVGARKRNE